MIGNPAIISKISFSRASIDEDPSLLDFRVGRLFDLELKADDEEYVVGKVDLGNDDVRNVTSGEFDAQPIDLDYLQVSLELVALFLSS